jgi:hypothetical protein
MRSDRRALAHPVCEILGPGLLAVGMLWRRVQAGEEASQDAALGP